MFDNDVSLTALSRRIGQEKKLFSLVKSIEDKDNTVEVIKYYKSKQSQTLITVFGYANKKINVDHDFKIFIEKKPLSEVISFLEEKIAVLNNRVGYVWEVISKEEIDKLVDVLNEKTSETNFFVAFDNRAVRFLPDPFKDKEKFLLSVYSLLFAHKEVNFDIYYKGTSKVKIISFSNDFYKMSVEELKKHYEEKTNSFMEEIRTFENDKTLKQF